MNRIRYFLIILICFVLQVTFFDGLRLFGTKPDLLLACVIFVGLRCPVFWALGLAFFAGALKDSFTAADFSLNVFLFPVWCISIYELNRKIRIENNYLRSLLAFLICVLQGLISGLSPAYTDKPIAAGHLARITIFTAFYTAAITPLFFILTDMSWKSFFLKILDAMRSLRSKIQARILNAAP